MYLNTAKVFNIFRKSFCFLLFFLFSLVISSSLFIDEAHAATTQLLRFQKNPSGQELFRTTSLFAHPSAPTGLDGGYTVPGTSQGYILTTNGAGLLPLYDCYTGVSDNDWQPCIPGGLDLGGPFTQTELLGYVYDHAVPNSSPLYACHALECDQACTSPLEGDGMTSLNSFCEGGGGWHNHGVFGWVLNSGDSTNPTVSMSQSGTLGANGWYVSNITTTITCTDTGSGCDYIYYCKDTANNCPPLSGTAVNVNGSPATAQTTTSTQGSSYIRARAKDNAANTSGAISNQLKIDTSNPTTSYNFLGTPNGDGTFSSGTVTLGCSDPLPGSGCDPVAAPKYCFAPSTSPLCTNFVVGTTVNFSTTGTYTIRYFSTDLAGNVQAIQSSIVNILNSPPGTFNISVEQDCITPPRTPSATIRWDRPSNLVDGQSTQPYNIYRSDNPAQPLTQNPVLAPADTSFVDDTVSVGSSYSYMIIASNAIGSTPNGNGWQPTTPLTINYCGIVGSCSPSPTTAGIGDTVTWTATGISGGTGTYTYQWDGDPPLSSTTNPATVQYPSAGIKNAQVTISSGPVTPAVISCSGTVTVSDTSPPSVNVDLVKACYTPTTWPGSFNISFSDNESGVSQITYRIMNNTTGGCFNFVAAPPSFGSGNCSSPNTIRVVTGSPLSPHNVSFPASNFTSVIGHNFQIIYSATNGAGLTTNKTYAFDYKSACTDPFIQSTGGDVHSNESITPK